MFWWRPLRLSPEAAGRGRAGRTAYTLLEVALAVGVLALMIGMALPATYGLRAEWELRQAQRSLASALRQAKYDAEETGQKTTVWLFPQGFLGPLPGGPVEKDTPDQPGQYWPGTIRSTVTPWGAEKAVREEAWPWVFSPSGICEPARVRWQGRNGGWLEVGVHPLTGEMVGETYEFQ